MGVAAIKVIAISGSGRTGSTLLSLLLSQAESVFNLGQLRDLWSSFEHAERCTCQRALPDCPVLSIAVGATFGNDDGPSLSEMNSYMRSFFRDAGRARDWGDTGMRARLRKDHPEFLGRLNKFLKGLQKDTRIQTFIDTSKKPEMALAFELLEGVELYVLNLVRDPRAVACSWHAKMGRIGATLNLAREWARRQARLGAWAHHLGARYRLVRYEDFCRAPKQTIETIGAWSGIEVPHDLFVSPLGVKISWERQHLYPNANERMLKERKSDIEIKLSTSWTAARNIPIHAAALIMTFPVGPKYILGNAKR